MWVSGISANTILWSAIIPVQGAGIIKLHATIKRSGTGKDEFSNKQPAHPWALHMPLIEEIQRRNVLRAGVAYTVVWWLLVQVSGLMLDAFDAPGWIFRTIISSAGCGFPDSVDAGLVF